eukprot:CAMPEP_0201522720 /NCGR_PEP_ID=MMETSP0161_2-20130828/18512_1 /ASSEMBLY_ACC=CAM_ASM_000251 /TAXON_ID=180227 /ORGANISM="Neoparamoeba aestuarina, Strain SoJaBio B1-5/56/2" /LENGTH=76 /DNA_ID=CAMNT_0047921643 /DNA_START=143 /DNA_END=373 /DNA_ORIENTATION=+
MTDAEFYRNVHEHLIIVTNFFADFLAYVERENLDEHEKLLKASQGGIHTFQRCCDGVSGDIGIGYAEKSSLHNLLE